MPCAAPGPPTSGASRSPGCGKPHLNAKTADLPIRRSNVTISLAACYMVRSRLELAASENSATSTEMLCWMGFHLHFFTSATSAMGM